MENAANVHLQWFRVFLVPEKMRTRDNDVKMVKQMFQLMFAIKYTKVNLLQYQIPTVNGLVWTLSGICVVNQIKFTCASGPRLKNDGIQNGSNVSISGAVQGQSCNLAHVILILFCKALAS